MPRKWTVLESLDLEAFGAPCNDYHKCPCSFCNRLRIVAEDSRILDEIFRSYGRMNEETKKIIAGYPEISMEDARLIFIRSSGRGDWKERSLDFQRLINIPTPIKDATREQAVEYISFLKTMIRELRSYVDGASQEYSREVAPEIEENHKQREAVKDSKRPSPKTLEGMLAKAGFTKEQFLAALKAREAKQ